MRHRGERTPSLGLGESLRCLWLGNVGGTTPRRGAAVTWVGRGAPGGFEQKYEAGVRGERGRYAVRLFLRADRRLGSCFEVFFVDATLLLLFI